MCNLYRSHGDRSGDTLNTNVNFDKESEQKFEKTEEKIEKERKNQCAKAVLCLKINQKWYVKSVRNVV